MTCELDRIADAMTGFDLNGFLTTLLATLIGAGVAAAVSFWLANRERPQPLWRIEASDISRRSERGVGSARVEATNIGDGVAYNVSLKVIGSKRWPPTANTVEPGGSLVTWVDFPMTGSQEWDVHTNVTTDTRQITWGTPNAVVEWQQPPRRTHVRRWRKHIEQPRLSAED